MTPIERFEAMLANGQDSDMLRLSLGQAYYKSGDYLRSATHLRAAVEQNPDYSVAWKLLGRALAEQGELSAALQAYDAGLAAAKKNGDKQAEKEIGVFRRRLMKQRDEHP